MRLEDLRVYVLLKCGVNAEKLNIYWASSAELLQFEQEMQNRS